MAVVAVVVVLLVAFLNDGVVDEGELSGYSNLASLSIGRSAASSGGYR